MGDIEKRIYKSRIDSKNLVAYSCLDNSGNVTKNGMGRTLNVSEGGILLEISQAISAATALSLSIGFEEEVCDISASVVYTLDGENGMFRCGIAFQGVTEEARKILKKFVEYFMARSE